MFRETHFNQFNKGKAIIRDYKDGITQCYLINTKGELLFKFPKNVWADEIEDDNVIFARHDINGKFDFEALFDTNGRQLTDFKYLAIVRGDEEGFFEVKNKERRHGHITLTGEEAVPCVYDDGSCFEEGVAPEMLNGRWGMVNHKNETVIPFDYDDICSCNNNRINAKLNGKWGIIDKFNNKLIDFKYDDLLLFLTRECGSMPAKEGEKWGIIDVFGSVLFGFDYDDCDNLDERGWYKFRQGDKWAIYSCEKNDFISPFIYDEIKYFGNGLCEVKKDGKSDCVDEGNTPISGFKYDYVHHFYKTNLISFKENDKTGLMNTGGKILLEAKFEDKIKYTDENLLVWQDKNYSEYVTDLNMKVIIPKKKCQNFFCGFCSGMIADYDKGYYNTKGEELKLGFEL